MWEALPDSLPHIEVNPTEIGDIVFGDQKFVTAVSAGTGPDTAIQGRHTFLQFAVKGLYQDITARFDAATLSRDDYTPVQLDETMWEGNIYGLPWNTDVRFLYWNKEHYAEAGLDPESPPTTWAELEANAAALNVGSGEDVERYGFVPYICMVIRGRGCMDSWRVHLPSVMTSAQFCATTSGGLTPCLGWSISMTTTWETSNWRMPSASPFSPLG